jgi:hypothetical protein
MLALAVGFGIMSFARIGAVNPLKELLFLNRNCLMDFLSTDTALRICLKQRKLLSTPRPYFFVTAMPKSASTFLHRVLLDLTGFGTAYFASAYGNIE